MYPFKDLQIGQSFDVANDRRYSVTTLAKKNGEELGRKFSIRDDNGTLKCFRIK